MQERAFLFTAWLCCFLLYQPNTLTLRRPSEFFETPQVTVGMKFRQSIPEGVFGIGDPKHKVPPIFRVECKPDVYGNV